MVVQACSGRTRLTDSACCLKDIVLGKGPMLGVNDCHIMLCTQPYLYLPKNIFRGIFMPCFVVQTLVQVSSSEDDWATKIVDRMAVVQVTAAQPSIEALLILRVDV